MGRGSLWQLGVLGWRGVVPAKNQRRTVAAGHLGSGAECGVGGGIVWRDRKVERHRVADIGQRHPGFAEWDLGCRPEHDLVGRVFGCHLAKAVSGRVRASSRRSS